ncbi:estradiol 17-beta-dehydrogenase 11-like [Bactrocera tryoni]|uniref:estradiol 17-beta-dehydrogenase 11-like n=1 Tax=Bactrocera tryoni TaxID=59916 RepID=UPI001A981E1B|nr:estradiol 17-beta-dehydrogenase 11-like [Bactrocera tryoni]
MVQPSNSVSANSAGSTNSNSNKNNIDIYNIVTLVLDIALLIFKFWVAIIESIVKTFVPQEVDVKGQTVLITGTGHGIGKELALQYSALGAKLICWDVNEEANQQTVKDIKAYGGEAYAYTCDVTKRDAINALAEKVRQEHGFINIVVNNAGIMPCHPILEHTETEIRTMFDINVLAHFWIIQAFLPEMLARNEGHFVALSSCAGLFGLPNLVPYCGTKFAVRGLMEALSEELRHKNPQNNIKFTTIYPYMVDTGLCKRPRYRFPSLFKLVKPIDAAASIIRAQRTSLEHASIPRDYLYLEKIGRLLPRNAMRLIDSFLDVGVESDK